MKPFETFQNLLKPFTYLWNRCTWSHRWGEAEWIMKQKWNIYIFIYHLFQNLLKPFETFQNLLKPKRYLFYSIVFNRGKFSDLFISGIRIYIILKIIWYLYDTYMILIWYLYDTYMIIYFLMSSLWKRKMSVLICLFLLFPWNFNKTVAIVIFR